MPKLHKNKTSLRLPAEVALLANAFDAREPNPSLINYKLSRAKEKAELPLKCIKVVPDARVQQQKLKISRTREYRATMR